MIDEEDERDVAVTSDYADPLVGRDFMDKYRIRSKLGEGGFGTVYRAIQLVVDREVAVKVLRPDRAADARLRDTLIKRFQREAVAMSKLAHPNTVQLIDFGTTEDDILFLVLELLTGIELSQAVATQAPMRPSRVAHICRQICLSLGEAHSHGIIHRDLKPGNVFLCHVAGEDDHVKVMDFGIARVIEADENQGHLTKTGMTQGTPAYMAPEQAMALKATPASDLYSMACMFYEMLTGEMVFTGDSSVAISLAHVNDAPPTLRIPGASTELSRRWDKLFQDLVHKKPQSRIPSASEVVERLEALAKLPDPGLEGAAGPVDALDQTEAATPAVVEVPEQDDLVTEFVAGAVLPEDEVRTELELPEISRGGSKLRALAAVIVVGLALLGLASLWGSEDEGAAQADVEPPASAPAVKPSPPKTAEAPRAPEAASPESALAALPSVPAAPKLAHLVLASQPSGALVYRQQESGEVLVCSTPCDVKVPAREQPETLALRSDGHEDKVLKVNLSDGAQIVLAVNLDPKKRQKAKRKRRAKPRTERRKAPAPPAPPRALPRLRTDMP